MIHYASTLFVILLGLYFFFFVYIFRLKKTWTKHRVDELIATTFIKTITFLLFTFFLRFANMQIVIMNNNIISTEREKEEKNKKELITKHARHWYCISICFFCLSTLFHIQLTANKEIHSRALHICWSLHSTHIFIDFFCYVKFETGLIVLKMFLLRIFAHLKSVGRKFCE